MQLVEQHVISKTDYRFGAIDQAAFASKNLYRCNGKSRGKEKLN
jgi:hypothetical protein